MPELKVCNRCGCLHKDIASPVCKDCYVPMPRRRTREQRQAWSIYGTAKWKKVRALALERDGYRCQRCAEQHDLVVHHDLERDSGHDPFDLDNLETLCRRCHGLEHKARRAHTDAVRQQ